MGDALAAAGSRSAGGRVVALAIAVLVTFWGVRFYQANTFEDEGWRLLSSHERMLTLETITSACARVHTPSVVETPETVEIHVRWTQQPVPCSGMAVAREVDVTLDQPLGDRTLLGCEGLEYGLGPPCEETQGSAERVGPHGRLAAVPPPRAR